MIKEYDIVESTKDLSEKILKNCKGTVVIVYSNSPGAYEVEFVNDVNETLDVLTVNEGDIIKAG